MDLLKRALIIFIRNPEKGKVKTRLAATVGEDRALSIYRELLQHTHKIALDTKADRFVFYADQIMQDDLWNSNDFIKRLQASADLGGKMEAAFSSLFQSGYKKIVIIGSDCLDLSTEMIEHSFNTLKNTEVVIGPATDGGYYLLGMQKPLPFIFDNKAWSTESVFQQTIDDLIKERISYQVLAKLGDIDTEEDWINSKSNNNFF